jgi:spore maturation protein CgeB
MQPTLQLFTAQNGMLSAKALFPNGTSRHIHSLVDPAVESGFYENLNFWGDLIIFEGIGLGYHVVPKISTIPKQVKIIVIEYFDELIENCRTKIFDKIDNEIVYVSASTLPEVKSFVLSIFRNNSGLKAQIVRHVASVFVCRQFYETAITELIPKIPGMAPDKSPVRALIFYGNFFLEEEIRNALIANDVEPVLFRYNELKNGIAFEDKLQQILVGQRPDFILSINMKGFDGNGALEDISFRLCIPVIVWFVDDPQPILMHRLNFVKSNMFAACWEKTYLPYLEKSGFCKSQHVPLATDEKLFYRPDFSLPQIDTGFVGTSMVDSRAGNIKEKFLWSDNLMPLVERMSDMLLDDPYFIVEKNIAVYAEKMSVKIPFSDLKNITWLSSYCIHTAGMKKRKKIIGSLVDDGIVLFGDPEGWKILLGKKISARPNIDYRHDLRDIYRSIKINVNITSCQMPAAVNQRVFDVPCSGSFVISDDQKDMHELFDVGNDAIVYESPEDLREKTKFYLSHDDLRLSIVSKARNRILNEHTYTFRIRRILQMLK